MLRRDITCVLLFTIYLVIKAADYELYGTRYMTLAYTLRLLECNNRQAI
jgi:hypothetical protein